MGFRKAAARAVSAASTVALKRVFHRPAGNFPGKMALYVDPRIIADMAYKVPRGSVVVVGTNGKTTVTNLLACALEAAGQKVACNRGGANLDSGIATTLLHAEPSDWGVFECDELWLAKVLPQLKSDYVLLLNLFRDQLDRVGEIDVVQDSIAAALASSPDTVLVYNADDPHCAAVAAKAPNPRIPFGTDGPFAAGEGDARPDADAHAAQMCQRCDGGRLDYAFRQYDQLGDYRCSACGFAREPLRYAACDVRFGVEGVRFSVRSGDEKQAMSAPYQGAYMVYNLLAVCAAANLLGCPAESVQRAIDEFSPDNGRLQWFDVQGRRVMTNLAKNPTGFDQNLRLVAQAPGRKVVAFFVNDKEGDGRDVSWLWDVDFESLAGDSGLTVLAGGIRALDVQVRLKYAGIASQVVEGAADVLGVASGLPPECPVYVVANYTALPVVKGELERLAAEGVANLSAASGSRGEEGGSGCGAALFARMDDEVRASLGERALRIVHVLPDLLNLYGDDGNVTVLEKRCAWRGVPVEVVRAASGSPLDFADADIVFIGGGPDREQRLAARELQAAREGLEAFAKDGGVVLAVCGGFQMLGRTWAAGDETLPGLGLLPLDTRREGEGRIVSDVLLRCDMAERPVIGYENHAGRTYLDDGVRPLGTVVNAAANGNHEGAKVDGAVVDNVFGTYLHGPLLAKSPQLADELLERALARRVGRAVALPALDDAVEHAANDYMAKRLG